MSWLTYVLAAGVALAIYLFLFGQFRARYVIQWSADAPVFRATLSLAGAGEGARTAIWTNAGIIGAASRSEATATGSPRLLRGFGAFIRSADSQSRALGGVWHASKNRSVFTDLLLWWSFTSWAVYAVANEKVPWLLVHICLPLALLGGVWLGAIALAPLGVAGVVLGLGAFFSLRSDYAMIFRARGRQRRADSLRANARRCFAMSPKPCWPKRAAICARYVDK